MKKYSSSSRSPRPPLHKKGETQGPRDGSRATPSSPQRRSLPAKSKGTPPEKRRTAQQHASPPPPRLTLAPGRVLLWGVHAVRAAWLNPDRRCTRLWVTEAGEDLVQTLRAESDELLLKRPDHKKVDRRDLDLLLPDGSVHQGVALEVDPLPMTALHTILNRETPPECLIVLDHVTDPHNVGAILRSAAAFGAGALIMTERHAPQSTGVMAKTACGALEHVPVVPVVNLARTLDELRSAGYWCIGLAEEGQRDLSAIDLRGRIAIVLGAEGEGLRQLTRKKCDELARLPTQPPIGSLNVSNAAAVSLYEVRRQKT